MNDRRSFSHAIAEGDGISVIASVDDPDGARSAESQRAEALVVRSDPRPIRQASTLPILWRADVAMRDAVECADAVLLVFDDNGRFEELHREATALGLDCAVEVRNEDGAAGADGSAADAHSLRLAGQDEPGAESEPPASA